MKNIIMAKLIHRKCRSYSYSEGATANTIFHGMKMHVLKAFHMIFRFTEKKKGMSTTELGCEVGVQQKTTWGYLNEKCR